MTKLLPYALLLCCGLPPAAALAAPSVWPGPDAPITPVSAALSAADTTAPLLSLVPSPSAAGITIRIGNDTLAAKSANIRLEWQLLVNGVPRQKGVLPSLSLSSRRPILAHLPLRLPPGNDELYLRVTGRRQPPASGIHPGTPQSTPPLFTGLLQLRAWHMDNAIPAAGDLVFSDSNGIFTITSANALLQFDKQTGWLLHYEAGHTLLMGDTAGLQPALWIPAIQPHLQLFSTSTGAQLVIVRAEYTLPEANSLLHLSYTINAAGEMLVAQSLETDSAHKGEPMPRFGMSWMLPNAPDSVAWYGLAFQDTAATPDVYHLAFPPVTDPRETVYPGVRWLSITGRDGKGVQIMADSSLLQVRATSISTSISTSDSSHSIAPPTGNSTRKLLGIDALLGPGPLPYGNYQYVYKISAAPVSPPAPPAPSRAKRI